MQHAVRGMGSALGTIGNALDLPLAYGEAVVHDLFDTHGTGRQWDQVTKDLREGGGWGNVPGALSNVAENDVYFRPGSMRRVLANPGASGVGKSAARFFLGHPKVSGAADFAQEFANPSNLVTGAVGGLAAKGLRAAPIIGPAIARVGEALSAAFDKYHPLRQAGGEEARMVGYRADAAAGRAKTHNVAVATAIFGNPGRMALGGLTRDEQFEILRQATGGAPKPVAHSSGISEADLAARAAQFRSVTNETDAVQRERGMLSSEHDNYFNMRGAYEVPETAREIAMGGAPQAGATGRMRWRAPTSHEKVFDSFDEVLAAVAKGAVKLKPDFNPYTQLVAHLNRVSMNVALDDFIRNLATTDAAQEVRFGGATGEQALVAARAATKKAATRFAAQRAAQDVARQFGLSPQDVTAAARRRLMDPRLANARLSENMRAGPGLTRIQRAVGNAKIPSAIGNRLTQQVGRVQAAAMQRGADLSARMLDPSRPISAAYRKLRDDYANDLMRPEGPTVVRGAPEAAVWGGSRGVRASLTPGEYTQVRAVSGLSGLDRLAYTDVKPEVVKYLTDAGAPARDAEGVGAWIDRYNSLFRIGILTNPLIHPGYNLLWSYLGGGGDPKRLVNVFRDSPLDHEAAEYGAHASLSGFTFGGNASRLVQSFPDALREGVPAAADWTASRVAEINRKIVFDTIERRMATEFWASLVAKGTDKAKAGELVRLAFGDYDNLTATERKISWAFFFYPWTKAVIPFWAKTLATKPQWLNAPMQAITTQNEVAGDPNVGKEAPFTAYTGTDKEGDPQYQALPMPQKRLEPLLEMALPRESGQVDPQGGLSERVQPFLNMAQYHLTPGLSALAGAAEQQFKEPQEPGVTPTSNVIYDKDAPLTTQLEQIGQYVGQNEIPFSELVGGIVHGAGEALGGAPGRAIGNLAGGFQYGEANPQEQHRLSRLFDGFQRAYNAARRIPDPAARHAKQTALYQTFRAHVDAILKAQR